jgi:hypothetical protein
MSTLSVTSGASITIPTDTTPIWIIQHNDPEKMLVAKLKQFFQESHFSQQYPNFGNVRIDRVHPFALMLFDEVMGQEVNTNVFPSITVTDSSETETALTLGRETNTVLLSLADITEIETQSNVSGSDNVLVAKGDMVTLKYMASTKDVVAERVEYNGAHTIDINMWADNKDVISPMYDMIELFFNMELESLAVAGMDILDAISGRRSGDINLEFGVMLYGANITVPCNITSVAYKIDRTQMAIIDSVDTKTEPTYHIKK